MELSDLLCKIGLDSAKVLVLRHRPPERELRRVFPWLAFERPEVFNSYQQIQNPRVENQIQKAKIVASFIGHTPGLAFFVGLYEVRGYKTVSHEQLLRMPAQKELLKLGMGSVGDRESQCFFDLELLKHYADWRGKLIVRWPPPGIAWARWAQDNAFPIHAILDEPIFDGKLPDWRSLVFTWAELAVMPTKWQAILAQTRGIYYIFDEQDGKGYVGSACGADNILGRWLNYSKSGHGGNKRLRKCDPGNLRFSILEVVPSDMESKEVIGREVMWKVRLHTRKFGLNEN